MTPDDLLAIELRQIVVDAIVDLSAKTFATGGNQVEAIARFAARAGFDAGRIIEGGKT